MLVVRRPKYACRACEDVVVQAPAPARLIEGGLPTEATVAQVLVSKYADHLPLYRQAQIYARQGITLDRSTLADWVGRAAWLLRPVQERLLMRSRVRPSCSPTRPRRRCLIPGAAAPRLASSGPMPATIGRGVAPIRQAWPTSTRLIARPSDRSRIWPASRASCRWTAMAAIACSAERGDVQLAFCWAHVRRRFFELAAAGPAPIASEALERIARLYAVEGEIRGRSADERRDLRQEKSRPVIDDLEAWLRTKLGLISQKIKLAEAIRYALLALGRLDPLPR